MILASCYISAMIYVIFFHIEVQRTRFERGEVGRVSDPLLGGYLGTVFYFCTCELPKKEAAEGLLGMMFIRFGCQKTPGL